MSERERRWKVKLTASTDDQIQIICFRLLALVHRTERSINILQCEVYGSEERARLCARIAAVMRKKMRTIWKTDEAWTPFVELAVLERRERASLSNRSCDPDRKMSVSERMERGENG